MCEEKISTKHFIKLTSSAGSMANKKSMFQHGCRYNNNNCLLDLPCTLPMILMLLGYFTQGLFADCPVVCECKWKGGKEAVTCINTNFTAIPVTLDPGTQALDITLNNIVRLRAEEFKKAGLLNLQKILLAKCRIKIIEKFAFRDLRNVVELDLSINFLDMVPTHIFLTLPELRELKLTGNVIQFIGAEAFKNASHLQKLDLDDNRITTISLKAFVGIEFTLQRLLLLRNRLTEVDALSFSILNVLNSLEIGSNPWNCTCTISDFREWILKQNIPISEQPSCKYPLRLRGKLWDTLNIDEFACVPNIQPSTSIVTGIEGQSITLSCKINGIPTPQVKWLLKHKLIANNTAVSFISGKKTYLLKSEKNLSSLTIPTADLQDSGVYTCSAENKAGNFETSITLVVGRKPTEDVEENKAVIAGIVVAIVMIVTLCTLSVFCLSVRKRRQSNRWRNRRTTNGRCNEDNYEKIEMNKVSSNKCPANIAVASVTTSDVPLIVPVRRNGDYCGVPNIDTDQDGEADEDEEATYADNTETPTPTNIHKPSEGKLWTAAATGRSISSPNGGHWNSNLMDTNLADSTLDPDDLHIPRRTKEETRDDCMKTPNSIYGIYNESQRHLNSYDVTETHLARKKKSSKISRNDRLSESNIYSGIHKTLQPHVLRKQILQEGGSLYSSIPVSSSDVEDTQTRYSSRLDISLSNYQQGIHLSRSILSSRMTGADIGARSDEDMYCTIPRRRKSYSRRSSYCGSESPLLPGSRCGSSGGESNVEIRSSLRRLSEDNSYYNSRTSIYPNLNRRTGSYLNLMSSKQNLYVASSSKSPYDSTPPDSTPLLNVGALEKRYKDIKSPSAKFSSITSTAKMYDYHSAQLEKLVVGKYHQMEDEMKQLKEACDNLKKLEEYKKQLRSRMLLDSVLHNTRSFSDYEECAPRSILKKSNYASTSRTPLLIGMKQDTASSSSLSRSREDFFGAENVLTHYAFNK